MHADSKKVKVEKVDGKDLKSEEEEAGESANK